MSYYQDLTPYEYCVRHEPGGSRAVNIGWLSRECAYPKGETSDEFKARLLLFCQDHNIVHVARGFHACDLCSVSWHQWFADREFRYGTSAHWASIGDGEIRVFGNQMVFAAPALIYHYVLEHNYLPPSVFIEAVLTDPAPDSSEYRTLLSKWHPWQAPPKLSMTDCFVCGGKSCSGRADPIAHALGILRSRVFCFRCLDLYFFEASSVVHTIPKDVPKEKQEGLLDALSGEAARRVRERLTATS